jgi:hypothetical protein
VTVLRDNGISGYSFLLIPRPPMRRRIACGYLS